MALIPVGYKVTWSAVITGSEELSEVDRLAIVAFIRIAIWAISCTQVGVGSVVIDHSGWILVFWLLDVASR